MQKYFIIALVAMIPFSASSQSTSELIKQMEELMLANYIFLDKAEETNAHLDALLEKNYFDSFTDPQELANAITEEMRKITHDKHLRMNAPRIDTEDDSEMGDALLQNLARYAQPMINEVKLLDHNIGYFDMRYFGGAEKDYADVDMVMKRLVNSDAIIVDMRHNGGGSPRMAQYLTSYFFDHNLLLNRINVRATGESREMWVLDVDGSKRPDVPVFILTSTRTFSGAEDFSYTMQQHDHRATTVGETSGGGAHPTRYYPLEAGYGVSIPFARTVNPVTKTNWEGVGVIPDVKCTADEALDKAIDLAAAAAKEYKESFLTPLTKKLIEVEDKEINKTEAEEIHKLLKSTVDANMLTENDINLAGYHYLNQGKLSPAIAIFSSNTILFPTSVNVYDSYAEGLAADGQNGLALEYYEKAVALAKEQNDRDLEFYERNLNAFKDGMK